MKNLDQFSLLWNLKIKKLITAKDWISNKDAYNLMDENWVASLPIVDKKNKLIWILTKKDCIRHEIYKPTLDKNWRLDVAVAVWIHWFDKIEKLYEMWINIFVLDTAHWYQKKMIESIKKFRKTYWKAPILIAWNVITPEATKALIKAWANWVKVGIW
jgi:IMP dehydrogenase